MVDDKPFSREQFLYVATNVEKESSAPKKLNGCNCEGVCLPKKCACIRGSTIRITSDRRIDMSKGAPEFFEDILLECSPETCKGCRGKCAWRLTPERFDLRVELYKTPNAGWAVRSRQCIETGTFIGEFVGEVVNPDMMEHRPVDYAYDLPLHNKFYKGTNIFVDPHLYGNITRFFNHGCFENLAPFRYRSYHRDPERISLGFYAIRDIIPGEPMTIDYGIEWWRGKITEAKQKEEKFHCCCDWVYCINPAPGKPQMPTEAAEREMAKRIMRNHKIVTGHQACERRARQKRQLDQKLEQSNVEMGQ